VTAADPPQPGLVDTHVHFWDKSIEGLHWPFLEPGFRRGTLHGTDALDQPTFLPPQFGEETAGSNVIGVVHVQAVGAIDDPALESAWLAQVAQQHGCPDAIVGSCYLAPDWAPALLRRHAAYPLVRGVRDLTAVDQLDARAAAPALDVCAEVGFSVEVRRRIDELAAIAEIASRWPDLTLVLSHACFPPSRTADDLAAWRQGIDRLADHPNVVCKISAAAGSADPRWTIDSIRPWVLGCVEAFGSARCMLGSNWPIDRLYGTYADVIAAYRTITSALSLDARRDLFHGTAQRVYRLDPAHAQGAELNAPCRGGGP
jgi:predicted TIM-barrel fold metal-dependent hydrolase